MEADGDGDEEGIGGDIGGGIFWWNSPRPILKRIGGYWKFKGISERDSGKGYRKGIWRLGGYRGISERDIDIDTCRYMYTSIYISM